MSDTWADLEATWDAVGDTWSTIFDVGPQEILFLRIQGASVFDGPDVIGAQSIVVTPIVWPGSTFGSPSIELGTQTIRFSHLAGASTFAGLSVSGPTFAYFFEPPSQRVGFNPALYDPPVPPGEAHNFARRFVAHYTAKAILLVDGTFVERNSPSQAELAAADDYWLGGHRHEITEETAMLLVDAGYTVSIEETT